MPNDQPIPAMNSHVPDPASLTTDPPASDVYRPVVGDYVTVLSSENDPQQVGKTGKITRDDQDMQPYRLTFEGVDATHFYAVAQVRLATPVLPYNHFE